jgi:hypothetical protein
MSFDPIEVDVDGTLRNPFVGVSVLLWALILLAVCLVILRSTARSRGLAVGGVLIGGWLIGPFVVAMFVTVLYHFASPRVDSVGFFGRAPSWIAPLVASLGVVIVQLLTWRRRRVA